MKKIIIVILISAFFFSCNKKRSKIEVIPNLEKGFLEERSVTEPAVPINKNFEDNLKKSLRDIVEKWYERNEKKDGYYPLNIKLFIDKKGKVVMIQDISGFDLSRIGINEKIKQRIPSSFDVDSKVLNDISKLAEDWEFKPANFMGVNVKYQKEFHQYYIMNSKAEEKIKLAGEDIDFSFDIMSKDFVAVEEMPAPIGGIEAIQDKIIYPEKAKQQGIEGRVFIKAYIDENGDVTRTEVLKGIGAGCDEVAMDAVKSTKFEPGRQRGKAVKVQVSIPILFKLSGDNKTINIKAKQFKLKETDEPKYNSIISGRVFDKLTGMAISGANVMIKNTKIGVATDENGEFTITSIPDGDIQFIVSSGGKEKIYSREYKIDKNKKYFLRILY